MIHVRGASVEIQYLKHKPECVETCARWSFDTWGHHTPHKTLHDYIESRKAYLNDTTLPLTLVASIDGIPAGMCSLAAERGLPLDATPWLAALYVAPEYRNRGIGTLLESAICTKAREMGYEIIYCFTSDPTVVPWYEKLSWQRYGSCIAHNHEVIVLKKILP